MDRMNILLVNSVNIAMRKNGGVIGGRNTY